MSGRRSRLGFFGIGRGRGRRLRTGKRIGRLVEERGGQVSGRRVSASGQEMENGFGRVTYPAKKDIGDEAEREGAGYGEDESKLCHVSNVKLQQGSMKVVSTHGRSRRPFNGSLLSRLSVGTSSRFRG